MASLTDLSIRRPVATAMVYLIVLVVGIVSFRTLPVDLLPKIESTQLTVRVDYPNVGPQEIEHTITRRIENAVSGLPNLERVTASSEEGEARIGLEFARGTNVDEAANDLRAALDPLRDEFPVEVEPPRIYKLDLDRMEIISLVATTTLTLDELTRILEMDIATRLKQIAGVGAIELRGGIYREVRVDLDRARLVAADLTALDVRDALARQHVILPGGNVKSGFRDLYVRPGGELQSIHDVARAVVAVRGDIPVRVEDVAEVRPWYQDVSYLAEANGFPSVTVRIQKQSGANTVEVADAIRDEVERINAGRDDLHLTILGDQSEMIRQSIASVRNSALWGFLLAVVVLFVFLRSGFSTAIVAFSIPISVIGTFGLLYFGGLTLNQMTFGGLALGVGLIVDNAIVVLESIVRKREQGLAADRAASEGTSEVVGAITASTLTTCVIFLPIVFTQSTSGALFQALALVVVFALACSLLVALTLVPMLAARMAAIPALGRVARSSDRRPFRRIEDGYVAALRGAMRRRGVVFAVTAALVLGCGWLWPRIPVELTPQMDANEIDVEIEMAQGTSVAVVRSYIDELEALVRRSLPPGQVELISTEVRGSDAEVELKLLPRHLRSMDSSELADRLRLAVAGQVPGARIEVDAQSGLWILRRLFSSRGETEAIEIELHGWDLERADAIAADMRREMIEVSGVVGVEISRREGRPEQDLRFDRERMARLGISADQVARAIQANVGGVEAGRLRDEGEEFPIIVRLRAEQRLTDQDLNQVTLRAGTGAVVPLSSIVERSPTRGPTEIERVDGQRVTYVSADLESGYAQGDAIERIRGRFADLELPEGYSIVFGGEYREQVEARRDFTVAIIMALVLVYMIMAAQFERFIDPLVVMLSVPVALVGVVAALLLTGTTLNMQSVMGLVMLVGIVVNNAIVLVDAINLLRRRDGLSVADAALEAARLRLRPILMTTLTTVLGLVPLALGIGAGSEIQAPLARVVIGGLLASTLVTLILIPVAATTAAQVLARLRRSS